MLIIRDSTTCDYMKCNPAHNPVLGTQQLAEELCAPVYSSSSLLGPSVTSAIASSTSFFASAVATRDAANPKTWPACGVRTSTIQMVAIKQNTDLG